MSNRHLKIATRTNVSSPVFPISGIHSTIPPPGPHLHAISMPCLLRFQNISPISLALSSAATKLIQAIIDFLSGLLQQAPDRLPYTQQSE